MYDLVQLAQRLRLPTPTNSCDVLFLLVHGRPHVPRNLTKNIDILIPTRRFKIGPPSMSAPVRDAPCQPLEPLLDYGSSQWKISSQRAADLYDSGVRLWRKEDLVDIEQQLAQSVMMEKFTIRRIDGSVVHIKNPMFGCKSPSGMKSYLGG